MHTRRFLVVSALIIGAAAPPGRAAEPGTTTPQRSPFFGDLHIHTMFSFDAFLGNTRNTPDDAYRYAKGEPIAHPSGGTMRLSGPPLDFLAVTDHSEFLGVLATMIDPSSPTYDHPDKSKIFPLSGKSLGTLRRLLTGGSGLASEQVLRDAWQREIDAAERANDPGVFTALIGYEYTPGRGNRHLHRNVIFKSSDVPELPFSSLDSPDPEDLWDWLDGLRASGIEVLAIPHNMNQSDGLAFMETDWKGKPIDRAFAEKRRRNEPIAEISQQKGTSETHPSLSPNDEWADFQIVQYYLNKEESKDPITVFAGGYWRDALNSGLEIAGRLGVNPFELGAIGSSDSHLAAGPYEEDRYFTGGRDTPQSRGSAYTKEQGGWDGYFTGRQATHGTGGLAAVWAEENTRASIFDALHRRETFATSGPRIRVRFFGGFGLAQGLASSGVGSDEVATAYAKGVPMGSVLPGKASGGPSFLVWALRDPNAGWLERAQVVKGWVEDGAATEQVFDVACSDGLAPDASTHRCPDNGARVDLSDCSISRDKGDVELKTVWTDADFDPKERAYYYVRVLENPSCRWSTWDAIRLGIEPNPDLAPVLQERAWSSPIWYTPE